MSFEKLTKTLKEYKFTFNFLPYDDTLCIHEEIIKGLYIEFLLHFQTITSYHAEATRLQPEESVFTYRPLCIEDVTTYGEDGEPCPLELNENQLDEIHNLIETKIL